MLVNSFFFPLLLPITGVGNGSLVSDNFYFGRKKFFSFNGPILLCPLPPQNHYSVWSMSQSDRRQKADLSLLKWSKKRLCISLYIKKNDNGFYGSIQFTSNPWLLRLSFIKRPSCAVGSQGSGAGGRGANLCVQSVSTFPVKRRRFLLLFDLSRSMIRITALFTALLCWQRAFQLTKCVDYHQSLNNTPVSSCSICPELGDNRESLISFPHSPYIHILKPDTIPRRAALSIMFPFRKWWID